MRKIVAGLAMVVCLVVLATTVRAWATAEGSTTILLTKEFQVTFDANGHSLPTIGQDAIGYYVVYTQYPIVNGVTGNGSIYY